MHSQQQLNTQQHTHSAETDAPVLTIKPGMYSSQNCYQDLARYSASTSTSSVGYSHIHLKYKAPTNVKKSVPHEVLSNRASEVQLIAKEDVQQPSHIMQYLRKQQSPDHRRLEGENTPHHNTKFESILAKYKKENRSLTTVAASPASTAATTTTNTAVTNAPAAEEDLNSYLQPTSSSINHMSTYYSTRNSQKGTQKITFPKTSDTARKSVVSPTRYSTAQLKNTVAKVVGTSRESSKSPDKTVKSALQQGRQTVDKFRVVTPIRLQDESSHTGSEQQQDLHRAVIQKAVEELNKEHEENFSLQSIKDLKTQVMAHNNQHEQPLHYFSEASNMVQTMPHQNADMHNAVDKLMDVIQKEKISIQKSLEDMNKQLAFYKKFYEEQMLLKVQKGASENDTVGDITTTDSYNKSIALLESMNVDYTLIMPDAEKVKGRAIKHVDLTQIDKDETILLQKLIIKKIIRKLEQHRDFNHLLMEKLQKNPQI